MKRGPVLATIFILACTMCATVDAQGRRTQTPGGVDLVEVVGCLTPGANSTWQLMNGSDPVVTRSASTSPEAIKAAETKALGKQRYALIGMSSFEPAPHQGHKMVVRGLLVKDTKETRINVTSFQMAAVACAN